MARIDSLELLNSEGGKIKLAEAYGKVIDNISATTISAQLKNTELSGDPSTGTVEANRMANSESKAYGTARGAGAGDKVKLKPVIVAIDKDKELIAEVEEKDVKLSGIDGLIDRKSAGHEDTMRRELERAFFEEAKTAGTGASLTKTTTSEKVSELIRIIEKTKNDFVDGVPRDKIAVILDTDTYDELRDHIDTIPNASINSAAGEVGLFHGVKVYGTVYLPETVTMMAMVVGSVAQPVTTWLDEAGKFPASNAYHFGMFYSYGVKAVMPDLIQYVTAG